MHSTDNVEQDRPDDESPAPRSARTQRYRLIALAVAVTAAGIGIAAAMGGGDAGSRRSVATPAPSVPAGSAPAGDKPQAPDAVRSPGEPVVSKSGSIAKDRRTLQVVSAKGDLTGNRELAWAADEGKPYGDTRCTQNFKIGDQRAAIERPTMLMCWRLSPTRSVYTIAVDIDRRPNAYDSVDTINEVWERLG